MWTRSQVHCRNSFRFSGHRRGVSTNAFPDIRTTCRSSLSGLLLPLNSTRFHSGRAASSYFFCGRPCNTSKTNPHRPLTSGFVQVVVSTMRRRSAPAHSRDIYHRRIAETPQRTFEEMAAEASSQSLRDLKTLSVHSKPVFIDKSPRAPHAAFRTFSSGPPLLMVPSTFSVSVVIVY